MINSVIAMTRRPLLRVLGVAAVVLLSVAVQTSMSQRVEALPGLYAMVPWNSYYNPNVPNQCVENHGFISTQGYPIDQWQCSYGVNQQWQINFYTSKPYGSVYLIKNQAVQQCMNVQGNQLAAATPIIQWTCNNSYKNEWWGLHDQTGGGTDYWIESFIGDRPTGYCLNVAGNSVSSGARMILWPCENTNNEIFHLFREA